MGTQYLWRFIKHSWDIFDLGAYSTSVKADKAVKTRNKWGLVGVALGGIWSLSTYFFGIGDMTYYDWKTANSEMLGMNTGQLIGMPLILGIVGFLAGLIYDLCKWKRR